MRKTAASLNGRTWLAKNMIERLTSSQTRMYATLGKVSEWTVRRPISGVLQTNPMVIQSPGHGFQTGDHVWVSGVIAMTQANSRDGIPKRITVIDQDQFSVMVDATNFSPYGGGGIVELVAEADQPDPNATHAESATARKEYFAYGRVYGGDCRLVAPRVDWFAGVIYDPVDYSDPALEERAFMVVSDGKLYKCLDNNSNASSTQQPTSISLAPFKTTDGYTWKFMCTIDPADDLKFGTDYWVPVSTLTQDDSSLQWDVQQAAVGGTVDAVVIENGGTGFVQGLVSLVVDGDGTGAKLRLDPQLGVSGGAVYKIVVDDPGVGYTWATVRAVSQTGTGARLKALVAPPKGHGSDLEQECLARHVMVTRDFDGSSGGVPVGVKFRRMTLLIDPLDKNGEQLKSDLVESCDHYAVSGVTGSFVPGQRVTTLTGAGFVVEVESGSLCLSEVEGTILTGQSINSATGQATVGTRTTATVDASTGTVLVVENRPASLRLANKIDRLKTVIAF